MIHLPFHRKEPCDSKAGRLWGIVISALALFLIATVAAHCAQVVINTGTIANDGTGDSTRTAFQKANTNFTTLFNGTLSRTNGTATNLVVDGVTLSNLARTNALAFINSSGKVVASSVTSPVLLGHINVRDFPYLAAANDSTDDTACLQTCVDYYTQGGNGWYSQRGGEVFIPNGIYKVSGQINIPPGISIRGESREGVIIKNYGTTNYVFNCNPTSGSNIHIDISDLTITQADTALSYPAPTAGGGIYIHTDTGGVSLACTLRNIWVRGCYQGVRLANVQVGAVEMVKCFQSIRDGFLAEAPINAVTWRNCYAGANGRDGYRGTLTYSSMISCASDQNGGNGYSFLSGSQSVATIACGAELNGTNGVYAQVCDSFRGDFSVTQTSPGVNGILIDGGYLIQLTGKTAKQGTDPTGYDIAISNTTSGSYPLGGVFVNGFDVTGYGAGTISDASKCTFFNSVTGGRIGIGRLPSYHLDIALPAATTTIGEWSRAGLSTMAWEWNAVGLGLSTAAGVYPAFLVSPSAASNQLYVSSSGTFMGANKFLVNTTGEISALNNRTLKITAGDSDPNSSVSAGPGSLRLITDASGYPAYAKHSGTASTNWVGLLFVGTNSIPSGYTDEAKIRINYGVAKQEIGNLADGNFFAVTSAGAPSAPAFNIKSDAEAGGLEIAVTGTYLGHERTRFNTNGEIAALNGETLLVTAGASSPESSITATVGSLYLCTGCGTNVLWIKGTGTGNTGWISK